MAFRWLFVGLKNPFEYLSKWSHLGGYSRFAPENSSFDEKAERCFMFYLIGNGLKWKYWENDVRLARTVVGSTSTFEVNYNLDSAVYKPNTKFTFRFGELFSRGNELIGIIDKDDELNDRTIDGEPIGRGFMVEIWSNNQPEIDKKDLTKYMCPMIEFVKEHPKSANVFGVWYGSITKQHRQT